MSDVFRRTGRGGAGNYISQKEIEEAERAQRADDLESQKDGTSISRTTTTASAAPASQPSPYVRSGRGGSGNYAEPPTVAESHDTQDLVDRTTAAVSASQAGKPRTGLTGRGGAGNWNGDAEKDEFEEKAERQRIADKIRHDIDASLPPPPRTYHQHDRDME